ncbi:fatty acid-binding protein, brain-like [Pygocentrus nattereri]|uniref:Cytosolic fatty-acid binding proteins domain-containing protein n=1 Tax=Pygocentrus nattereri TaxID=42514 RepID=A0AAR2KDV4_PYGNA|nr:fatty acid-binding protein, brain-like [Pygocentrus nattereri]
MEAFFGNWKLVSSENFEEYMRAIGWAEEVVQIGNIVTPVLSIYQDGEKLVMKLKTSVFSSEKSFVLGEEFDEHFAGQKYRSVINLDDGKLVQTQKWDGKMTVQTRKIQDGKMILTLSYKDTVAVRTYEKMAD